MTDTAPILVLTTKPQRPAINIDGTDHRLSFYEDFSPFQAKRFVRLLEGSAGLLAADAGGIDELAEEEQERLYQAALVAYADMIRIVLPTLPPETLALLDLAQRQAIVGAFLAAVTAATPVAAESAPSAPVPGEVGLFGMFDATAEVAGQPPTGKRKKKQRHAATA